MSKILIIEDEEAIADLEKDYLELSGFEVEIANRGDVGLEKALNEYNGALILVSHDKTFLKNTTSKTWSFEKLNEQTYEIKEF
jgi:DNA-binding NtrC family response regulator